jgi:ATP-dependent DNA helicase RecQ
VKALDYFQERGWAELESKQMTEVYSVRDASFSVDNLSEELHRYFKRHEESEIARIGAMLELLGSSECLSWRLAEYFGDQQAPRQCGHCSVCAGHVARLPQPPTLPALDGQALHSRCAAFLEKYCSARGLSPSADCVTRFLCGISVPAFTRMKARTLPGYATLEDYPYAQVRDWVQAQL